MKWHSNSHSKYLLQYHLIFVCKYRKKLLDPEISDDVKQLSFEICNRHHAINRVMETDKDHIHYTIETTPNCNLANLVKAMKSYITYHIWDKHWKYLSTQFWKE